MVNGRYTRAHRRLVRLLAMLLAVGVVAAACGSSENSAPENSASEDTASEDSASENSAEPVIISNQGGSNEGHTPRGFEGSGTGLFAGDELNPNFPADDGVQIWLTFELPDNLPESAPISQAILRSDALTVRGNPFEALGNLQAEPVRYDTFGPPVVNLEPVGSAVTCSPPEGSTLTCDVSEAVQAELAEGRTQAQFRLRFEGVSDPDGEQDLALFFLTDSNTNEPGIFQLELR